MTKDHKPVFVTIEVGQSDDWQLTMYRGKEVFQRAIINDVTEGPIGEVTSMLKDWMEKVVSSEKDPRQLPLF